MDSPSEWKWTGYWQYFKPSTLILHDRPLRGQLSGIVITTYMFIEGESEFLSCWRLFWTKEDNEEKPSNGPNDANEDNVFSDSSLGRIDVKT